jgi:hypothetical protein
LEIGLHRREANLYAVELRSRSPDSDADPSPGEGTATFDFQELQVAGWDGAEAVGQALTDRLFSHSKVLAYYQKACTAAERDGAVLRIRLFIGPTASELHALPWELLRDPDSGRLLATRERVLFSRYLSSHDWRPVKLRPRAKLRALVAIANPGGLDERQFPPVDVEGERKRAGEALGEIPIVEVTGPSTFDGLIERLREEFDVLYLVAHGTVDDGEPFLWLESADGSADRRSGRDLVDKLADLPRPPRLVVLASCRSGDTGTLADDGAMVALGPKLAEAGIPAVVAMQGNVSMATVERFMPEFFRELCRDGQIDRAMAAARFEARDRPDVASPVLFLRLISGRIWYVPGFARAPGQDFDLWPALLEYLEARRPKATPILGSGLLEPYLGTTREFARRWARHNQFPLAPHAQEDLPQVAQYLSVRFKASALRSMFESELVKALECNLGPGWSPPPDGATASELIAEAGARRRAANASDPHRVLAGLPLPIYLTTNPDRLLVEALREAGKDPQVAVCPWNERVDDSDSVFRRDPDFRPTVDRPLVYYLLGRLDDPRSLVLTEDDYFDYLIGLTRNNELVPGVVRRALVDTALLFLGFRLDDWDFRILFRSLMAQGGRRRSEDYTHVAVQIDPEEAQNLDPEGARRFLLRYFSAAEINIYWGHVDDFARELHDQARRGKSPAATMRAGS